MVTPVFLTIDTELVWRHHVDRLGPEETFARSIAPAGVGIDYQLERLSRHGLKACFFVDPMPALAFGLAPTRRIVEAILAAGQEVQLHVHPNWTAAVAGDGGDRYSRFEMIDYSPEEQRDLIAGATELLVAAGAPRPIAFRGGSYSANDATLRALAAQGFRYDSSHNGAKHPYPSCIGLPARQIAPVMLEGIAEIPVTVIEERAGGLRHFQICALSAGEMRAALEHAHGNGHAAVTIVSHSFELANRTGTRANAVHVRRFEALCAMLAELRAVLPTTHFADSPALVFGHSDVPLEPNALRTGWRQAQQIWSNVVAERAA